MPLSCIVSNLNGQTAIARHWLPGAPTRCGLCPGRACTSDAYDNCLVLVGALVADDDAWLFRRPQPSEIHPDVLRL